MKLQETFEELLLDIQSDDLTEHNILISKFLNLHKETILNCDEFKDVDELIIIESPSLANTNNEIFDSISYKISNKTKFYGKAYLYSIGLTPRLYDLDNKPFYSMMVRGIFENVVDVGGSNVRNIGELNLDYNNQPFFTVFVISHTDFSSTSNETVRNVQIVHKHIPIELKELFLETFTNLDEKLLEIEKINIFLEKNKIN